MIKHIIEKVHELAGHEYLYFDTVLEIKTTPHTAPLSFWAVTVCPTQTRVYLMDANEHWTEVHDRDAVIISSLYQRIGIIHKTKKQAICN